jgi:hypothetical protein
MEKNLFRLWQNTKIRKKVFRIALISTKGSKMNYFQIQIKKLKEEKEKVEANSRIFSYIVINGIDEINKKD